MQSLILLLILTAAAIFSAVKYYRSTRVRTFQRPRRR